ncbi:MAG: lipid A biosynthesis acyltransferase [Rhodocyclaceae bacterium]|nr:lipid A biosynthesis acyltransferase [Accumulibacter sp.]HNJ76301.1 lipid A biosynthesis acyltransferase [Azospira sp.]HNN07802.1 lipid A biosynthesis acyltransferase [Azospira sp.]HNN47039.1 lipid A biosynthesis acyltransferase [Azospira sp.]
MLSRAAVALLWLLHFLPLTLLAPLGRGLGALLFRFAKKRRHIVRVNLALCFPELDAAAREALARRHFAVLGRSMLERSLFWWASRERLNRIVKVTGDGRVRALQAAGRPVMLLAPHFVGLDAGGVAVTMRFDIVSIYAEQSDPVFDRLLLAGRSRFGDQQLLSRADGPRATVKAMKAGRPFYYLPDMDFRTKDAIFAPFFGVPAWTITGLSRLSRLAGAAVVPCVTRMLPGGEGYRVEFGEPWEDFPSEDAEADTRRMNAWLEAVVRTMPEQYYWVHRRFKTRPDGETRPYRNKDPESLAAGRRSASI